MLDSWRALIPRNIAGLVICALAQLGWSGGAGSWKRDGEKLVISEVETARGPLWRLMLQPNS